MGSDLQAVRLAAVVRDGSVAAVAQWIVRVLANPLIACDAVMLPFAREVLGRAQAEAGPGERIDLILDHVTNERVALKSAEYSLSQRPMQHHVLIPSAPDLVRDYVASERVALRRAKY